MDNTMKDTPHGALVITIGAPGERKKAAKNKLRAELQKVYDSWKPKSAEGIAYDRELKALLDAHKK